MAYINTKTAKDMFQRLSYMVDTMTDFIGRQEAIDLIKKWADGYSYVEIDTTSALRAFDDLPSADVEPVRHGRWERKILIDFCGCKHVYYVCSVCGKEQNWDDFDYCPSCGAKMDGDENANDITV